MPRAAALDVVHFRRPGGWHVLTNFGTKPVPLPAGDVLLTSAPLEGDRIAGETTVWFRAPE